MMDIQGHEIYTLECMKELLSKIAEKHLIIEGPPKKLVGNRQVLKLKLSKYLK
jgi:hypothetical protein